MSLVTALNVRSQGIPGLVTTGHDCSTFSQDVSPPARIELAKSLPRAVRRHLPIGKSKCYGCSIVPYVDNF